MVAANAGGAFSPFGDITTLMVWQRGFVEIQQFFALLVPSIVNWLVTAGILLAAVLLIGVFFRERDRAASSVN